MRSSLVGALAGAVVAGLAGRAPLVLPRRAHRRQAAGPCWVPSFLKQLEAEARPARGACPSLSVEA